MLNDIISKVLNKFLDGNIESIDCYSRGNCRFDLITQNKISYKDFVKKTKNIISENDISSYDEEDSEYLEVTIELTEDFINKIINHIKCDCMNEFEEMKK